MNFFKKYWRIIVLILVPLLLFICALNDNFLADDYAFLNQVSQIDNLSSFSRIIFSNLGGDYFFRPIINLSFFVDYSFWGNNPFGYHLNNLIIFCATVLVLFLLVKALIADEKIAFYSALLFSVLSTHHETVTWLAGRTDLYATFFYFLTLLFYVFYRKKKKALFLIIALVSFVLALFSKESAITLLGLVFITDLYFFINGEHKEARQIGIIRNYLFLGLLLLAYFLIRLKMLGALVSAKGSSQILGSIFVWDNFKYFFRAFIHPLYYLFNRSLLAICLPALNSHYILIIVSILVLIIVVGFCTIYKKFSKKYILILSWSVLGIILNLILYFAYFRLVGPDLMDIRFYYTASAFFSVGLSVFILYGNKNIYQKIFAYLLILVFILASFINYQAWAQASERVTVIANQFAKLDINSKDLILYYGLPANNLGAQLFKTKESFEYLMEKIYHYNNNFRQIYGFVPQPELNLCQRIKDHDLGGVGIYKWSEGANKFNDYSWLVNSWGKPTIDLNLLKLNWFSENQSLPLNNGNLIIKQAGKDSIVSLADPIAINPGNYQELVLKYKTFTASDLEVYYTSDIYPEISPFNRFIVDTFKFNGEDNEIRIKLCEYPSWYSVSKITNLYLHFRNHPTDIEISELYLKGY